MMSSVATYQLVVAAAAARISGFEALVVIALVGAALITAPGRRFGRICIVYLATMPFSVPSYARVKRQRAAVAAAQPDRTERAAAESDAADAEAAATHRRGDRAEQADDPRAVSATDHATPMRQATAHSGQRKQQDRTSGMTALTECPTSDPFGRKRTVNRDRFALCSDAVPILWHDMFRFVPIVKRSISRIRRLHRELPLRARRHSTWEAHIPVPPGFVAGHSLPRGSTGRRTILWRHLSSPCSSCSRRARISATRPTAGTRR